MEDQQVEQPDLDPGQLGQRPHHLTGDEVKATRAWIEADLLL